MSALFAAAAVAGAFLLFEFGARRLYNYRITPVRFEVRLFGRFALYWIALRDIEEVEAWHVSRADLTGAFTTLRLGNRILGRPVVIRLRGRFPRRVVVTPDDAVEFMAELRAGIAANSSAARESASRSQA